MSTHAKFVQAIAAAPDAATWSMACVGLADSMWWFSAATLADGTSASSKDLYVAAITLAADTSAVAKGYVGLGDTLWRGQQATVNGTRVGKAAAYAEAAALDVDARLTSRACLGLASTLWWAPRAEQEAGGMREAYLKVIALAADGAMVAEAYRGLHGSMAPDETVTLHDGTVMSRDELSKRR